MIRLGQYNRLRVIKQEPHGFYLEGDEDYGNILLPNNSTPDDLEIGDEIEVFIYLDSKDIVIATTQRPLACVGEFARLKVVSVQEVGAFLDWGLTKDLFVPFREQLFELTPGQYAIFYVYIDQSHRIAATTRLKSYIDQSKPPFKEGDQVDLLLYQYSDLGIKAIINGSHSGLIYQDDIRKELRPGDAITGFIRKIRPDGKIDLSLTPEGLRGRKDLAEQILDELKASGGTLEINAKTPAETISELFNVSRKKFKIALGFLYKKELITIDDKKITLKDKGE